MDLSSQQGNRELVNNVKMGLSSPRQLGKSMHFRVSRVKLSFREAHQKIFYHQNGVQDCSGWGSRRGVAARGVHGKTPR